MTMQTGHIRDKCSFNPRAREGRDQQRGLSVVMIVVSIHAPARGATVNPDLRDNGGKFQSTRPRGARRGSFSNDVA